MKVAAMKTPASFDAVAPIAVTDPLAALLGAAEGGRIEYRYLDAVKLAGHSCPTVAGAWLMTRTALARLYPDEAPPRGGTRVELRQPVDEGVTGVIASVYSPFSSTRWTSIVIVCAGWAGASSTVPV